MTKQVTEHQMEQAVDLAMLDLIASRLAEAQELLQMAIKKQTEELHNG